MKVLNSSQRRNLRRFVADKVERHIVLAVNVGIFGVVASMTLLVMILPFDTPSNVLLSAAAIGALASAGSVWWAHDAGGAAPHACVSNSDGQAHDPGGLKSVERPVQLAAR